MTELWRLFRREVVGVAAAGVVAVSADDSAIFGIEGMRLLVGPLNHGRPPPIMALWIMAIQSWLLQLLLFEHGSSSKHGWSEFSGPTLVPPATEREREKSLNSIQFI